MKKLQIFLIALLISAIGFSQTGLNYKALIKDANGNALNNADIDIQFRLLQGLSFTNVYEETHTITTDANGIVVLTIGQGTTTGDFKDVEWILGEVFLNVQVDSGSGFVDLGTTEFQYVPFAYASEIAAEAKNVNGLEAINEGNGIGWRLVDRNPDNYGDIGENAIDFSEQPQPINLGATGELSVAYGRYSHALGYSSFAMGDIATAGGEQSFSFGEQSRSSGDFSIAMGFNGLASGDYSASIGRSNLVFGNASFAAGTSNQISSTAENAFAMGQSNFISSDFAIAMGDDNTVSGSAAITLGRNNESQSSYATAIGLNNNASGFASFAAGSNNTTQASYSTAFGNNGVASGQYSFAAGFTNTASATGSTAAGNSNTASGASSTAIGLNNQAIGSSSVALGFSNEAIGSRSVAIGDNSIASGVNSVAIGDNLEARASNETVLGYANTLYNPANVSSPRIFTIGNGVLQLIDNNIVLTRRNAMVILRNGNVGFGTSTPQEGLHIANGRLRIGTETIEDGGSNILRFNASLIPDQNSVMSLGNSSLRWTTVYANNGTINTSDRREKKNIKNLDYGLNEVLKMQPVIFNWKDKSIPDTKLGLIAQDLLKITPEVVKTHIWEKDEVSGALTKKELDRLGVYYSDLVPVLIKAIQEQQETINNLKSTIQNNNSTINNQKQLNTKQSKTLEALLSRVDALEQSNN